MGGGSDLPSFYEQFGGETISVAIDKYLYIACNHKFDDTIRVSYSRTENVSHVDDIEHDIVREVLKQQNIQSGIELVSVSDIPAGSGLGSSSTFTVGLYNAIARYKNSPADKAWLAEHACHMEIDVLAGALGKQDQYAAAYGGLNHIYYHQDGSVDVNPISLSSEQTRNFENALMVYYTNQNRLNHAILQEQSSNLSSNAQKIKSMQDMVAIVGDFKNALATMDLQNMGQILDYGWQKKKEQASNISNPDINAMYDTAISAGAYGGKLLGAGGGGFLAFIVPQHKQDSVANAMAEHQPIDVGFDFNGSTATEV